MYTTSLLYSIYYSRSEQKYGKQVELKAERKNKAKHHRDGVESSTYI